MKKLFFLFYTVVILNISLSAQKNKPVIVREGTRIVDYFPFQERYRYPVFTTGQITFKNGTINSVNMNYNLLMDEMEFIQSHDTLSVVKKKEIRYVVIAVDTFLYDNGYLEQIYGSTVKVGLRQRIKLKEVLKKDPYGTSSSGSATNSFGQLPTDNNLYKLTVNEDMVFQKMEEYYLKTPTSGFVQFRKKNVLQLFPEKSDAIKSYLKSNKVNFDFREDLLRLAEYLNRL
jgi:hypothetical protein